MIRIGVDLGGTKIEALALDQHGRELERKRVATPKGDYQGTIKTIVELVTFLEEKTGEKEPLESASRELFLRKPGW